MKTKIKKILALAIAGATLIGMIFAVVSCNNQVKDEVAYQVQQTDNPMVLTEKESEGISLMSVVLASADYTDYGVSPAAETAYTLTATVSPPSATGQELLWSVDWVNPNNEWAKGKTASDYVDVIPATSGGKTATAICNKPFGSQIKITVKAKSDESKFASCLVDYAQKVEAVTLNFGNIPINLGGKTAIKYEIAAGKQGSGGTVDADFTASSTYTLSEEFTCSVTLSQYADYVGKTSYFSLKDSAITGAGNFSINTEYYGEEIYYDYEHDIKQWMIVQRTGDILFKNLSTEEIASYLSDITLPGLYQVNFSVKGKYNTYTYTSQVYCSGYTNNTPVNAVAMSSTHYVF